MEYTFLQDLFFNEFIQDPDYPPEYFVRKCLKAFIDDGIIVPHPTLPDTYNMTSKGFKKLKIFACFMTSLLLSYWIVLHYFEAFPKSYHDNKQRINKIQAIGMQMYKRREVEQTEALSKINYENAMDFFIKNRIRGSEDKEKIDAYRKAIESYLDVLG
jgi:glycerol-3-phosphate O-acyltransferase